MSSQFDKAQAALYETIYSFIQDSTRAFSLMRAVPDASAFTSSDAAALSDIIGYSGSEIENRYRNIMEAFSSEALRYSVILPESIYFPEEKGDWFPVIYGAGDITLLKKPRVTVIGMPRPSMQGKQDTAEAISYFSKHDVAVLVPLDPGIGLFAAALALKAGCRVIGVLSTPLSASSSEFQEKVEAEIYSTGLLLSVFPPRQKTERWHVMIRNRFIASISGSVLLAEEKDGGPSWAIFDKVLENGGRAMLSRSMLDVPSYRWARERMESGALSYATDSDLKRIVPKVKSISFEPDLFS